MSKPTIFETPNGERMAVLPLADYERLMVTAEDTADIRSADEVTRRIASGEDELIPAEFANRILDGENPIRVYRDYRGLSGKDLAAKAGISSAFLSQIEKGEREGSFGTMKKIAEALGVTLDDLA